jgi:hypothetical protein
LHFEWTDSSSGTQDDLGAGTVLLPSTHFPAECDTFGPFLACSLIRLRRLKWCVVEQHDAWSPLVQRDSRVACAALSIIMKALYRVSM